MQLQYQTKQFIFHKPGTYYIGWLLFHRQSIQ